MLFYFLGQKFIKQKKKEKRKSIFSPNFSHGIYSIPLHCDTAVNQCSLLLYSQKTYYTILYRNYRGGPQWAMIPKLRICFKFKKGAKNTHTLKCFKVNDWPTRK